MNKDSYFQRYLRPLFAVGNEDLRKKAADFVEEVIKDYYLSPLDQIRLWHLIIDVIEKCEDEKK